MQGNAWQKGSAVGGENRTPFREGKRRYAVSSIGRSEQRKQRLILIDGQQLPVQWGPPGGAEAEGEGLNLAEIRFVGLSDCGGWRDADYENQKRNAVD